MSTDAREQWEKSKAWSEKTGLTAVVVQLQTSGYFESEHEFEARSRLESRFRAELQAGGLGTFVTGITGSGAIEIFLHVKTEILTEALLAVKNMLMKEAVLGCARIDVADYSSYCMRNFYPQTSASSLHALRRAGFK